MVAAIKLPPSFLSLVANGINANKCKLVSILANRLSGLTFIALGDAA